MTEYPNLPLSQLGDAETRLHYETDLKAEAERRRSEEMARLIRLAAGFVGRRVLAPIARWYRREQLREDLMRLDDRTLADIGLSRVDIPKFVEVAHPPKFANDTSGTQSEPRRRLAA